MTIQNSATHKNLRRVALCLVSAGAILVLGIADASAARGGGGGGRMAQSSVSGANRSMSGGGNRASTGNMANGGNRANTGNINTGNNGNRVNTGDVNIGNDVNVDIDGGYNHWHGYHGGYYHPVATAAFIGAVAVTTAAVVGSYYYALPPSGCTVVIKNGISYHYCGSVYYQQTWSGNDVVYVVVNP